MERRSETAIPLVLLWLAALIVVLGITLTTRRESTSFQGIAETKEKAVSTENAVEISRILVGEGQSVLEGQLLVELIDPELTITINHCTHQLEQLRAQKKIDAAGIRAQIKTLEADRVATTSEYTNHIRQLQNQYALNKELTAHLKSIAPSESSRIESDNPITLQIESLREELRLSLEPLSIKLELLQRELSRSDDPAEIQVERLDKELAMLQQQHKSLRIYADLSGVVGSVFFKAGEQVPPFTTIMTVHPRIPSFVKGYLYEKAYSRIRVGDSVTATAIADTRHVSPGRVVGVGARIVEYPARLRKHPELTMWGREVIIKIADDNPFILGERVLIATPDERGALWRSVLGFFNPRTIWAESGSDPSRDGERQYAVHTGRTFPIKPLHVEEIEASGLLHLPASNQWLVISDDTPANSPMLLLMRDDGQVIEEPLVSGLEEIDDMESCTLAQDGIIIIASSLSANEKGDIKKNRRLLIAVESRAGQFALRGSCDLTAFLRSQAAAQPAESWSECLTASIRLGTLDVEGMSVRGSALFLGLKAPQLDGQTLIMKIDSVNELFSGQEPLSATLSMWQTLVLKDRDDLPPEHLSDLLILEDRVLITGVAAESGTGTGGSLWEYSEKTGAVRRLYHFEGIKPEGIAAGKRPGTWLVCFDQGASHPSLCVPVEEVS